MLPLASLMNPDGAVESDPMIRLRPSGMSSTPATPYSDRFPSPLSPEQGAYSHGPPSPPRTAPREVYFHTGQTKGPVNYPPHENLDDHSLAEVRKFRVEPFGAIRETCRHVPYNSNKKDFGAKTGMESLEVFEYTFYAQDRKLPEKENRWTVLWDYNVGLVRITNFFKCLGYSKTVPSRSLSQNPGLKSITPSITGGSISAQGYWMPFNCAKAMCAKFCYDISGALIPIFGPQFPAECVPKSSPEFGRFCIDPEIVEEAIRQAQLLYYGAPQPALAGDHGGFHHHHQEQRQSASMEHYHSPVGPPTPRDIYPRWTPGRDGPRYFLGEQSPPYRRVRGTPPFQGALDYTTPHRGHPRRDREFRRSRAERVRSPSGGTDAENDVPSPRRTDAYMDMDVYTAYNNGHRHHSRSQYRHSHRHSHRQTLSNTSLPSMQRELPSVHSSPGDYRLGEPAPLTPSPPAWSGGEYPAAQSSSPGSPYHYESSGGVPDRSEVYHRPGAYKNRHTHHLLFGGGEHGATNPMLSAIPRSQPWMQRHHQFHHHRHHQPHPSTGTASFRSEPHYYRTAPPTPQPLPEELSHDHYAPAPSSSSSHHQHHHHQEEASTPQPATATVPQQPAAAATRRPSSSSSSSAGNFDMSVTNLASAAVAAMARHSRPPSPQQREEEDGLDRHCGTAADKDKGDDVDVDRMEVDKDMDAAAMLLDLGNTARKLVPVPACAGADVGGDTTATAKDVAGRFASPIPSHLGRSRKRALSM